jgi:hypothetical protein
MDGRVKPAQNAVRALSTVIVRLDRTIQYTAASGFITAASGILDHPPEPVIGRRVAPTRWRAMTGERLARSLSRHCERSEAIHVCNIKKDGLLRRKGSSQ